MTATGCSGSYKEGHSLEVRKAESARIMKKYVDRFPVIVEKAQRSDVPTVDKCKFLVPYDLTVGQFACVIRKRINLSSEKAMFLFVDNVLPPTGAVMSTLYKEKKDEDGFLYFVYSAENTFGEDGFQLFNVIQSGPSVPNHGLGFDSSTLISYKALTLDT